MNRGGSMDSAGMTLVADGAGKASSRATSIAAIPGSGRQRPPNLGLEYLAAASIHLSERDDAVGQAPKIADDSHRASIEKTGRAATARG